MINVEPSFVLYALLLDPGCCLRAHIILIELVEPEKKKKNLLSRRGKKSTPLGRGVFAIPMGWDGQILQCRQVQHVLGCVVSAALALHPPWHSLMFVDSAFRRRGLAASSM